jgi:hypothetical protein
VLHTRRHRRGQTSRTYEARGRSSRHYLRVRVPLDLIDTIGLPRYAKQAVDQQFARWVMLHAQSNPLPICTRPRILIKGKRT